MKRFLSLATVSFLLFSCNSDDDNDSSPSTSTQSEIPSEYQALEGIFNGNGVGAATDLGVGVVLLFNQNGNQYAWFEDEAIQATFSISDEASIFRDLPFTRLGAATRTAEGRLCVFDSEGERFAFADIDTDAVTGGSSNPDILSWEAQSEQTENWMGSSAFNKISAMWTIANPNDACFGATIEYEEILMANGEGTRLQPYFIPGQFFSNGPFDVNILVIENNCGGQNGVNPFTSISAACRYIEPTRIDELLFSANGMQFCFYTVSEGVVSEVYDLY